jgi:hypothetical protein
LPSVVVADSPELRPMEDVADNDSDELSVSAADVADVDVDVSVGIGVEGGSSEDVGAGMGSKVDDVAGGSG